MNAATLALLTKLSTHLSGLEFNLYDVFPVEGGGWKVVSTYDKTKSPAVLAEGTLEACLTYVAEHME